MNNLKICSSCTIEKELTEFYCVGKRKNGEHRFHPMCKECVLEYNRKKYAENPEYPKRRKSKYNEYRKNQSTVEASKQRNVEFYKSIQGRAKTLFKSAQRRKHKWETDFDITYEWIKKKLENGICEVTGLPFDFNPHPVYNKNPFAPSIDRIDSTKGYCKDNVRIVLWQVNLMRGEMKDEEILNICLKVVEGLHNEKNVSI